MLDFWGAYMSYRWIWLYVELVCYRWFIYFVILTKSRVVGFLSRKVYVVGIGSCVVLSLVCQSLLVVFLMRFEKVRNLIWVWLIEWHWLIRVKVMIFGLMRMVSWGFVIELCSGCVRIWGDPFGGWVWVRIIPLWILFRVCRGLRVLKRLLELLWMNWLDLFTSFCLGWIIRWRDWPSYFSRKLWVRMVFHSSIRMALYGRTCPTLLCRHEFLVIMGKSWELDVNLVALIIVNNQSAQRKRDVTLFVFCMRMWFRYSCGCVLGRQVHCMGIVSCCCSCSCCFHVVVVDECIVWHCILSSLLWNCCFAVS